jgi:hypothetical protein
MYIVKGVYVTPLKNKAKGSSVASWRGFAERGMDTTIGRRKAACSNSENIRINQSISAHLEIYQRKSKNSMGKGCRTWQFIF